MESLSDNNCQQSESSSVKSLSEHSEVLSGKILDDLFYPAFDKLKGIDLPTKLEVTA